MCSVCLCVYTVYIGVSVCVVCDCGVYVLGLRQILRIP